jgi:hypothetical protein
MFVYMNDFWLKKKKSDFVGYWATKSQARFKTVERKGEILISFAGIRTPIKCRVLQRKEMLLRLHLQAVNLQED